MLPAILPFLFAIFWASSYAAAKIGLADITPYAFVAIRLTLAAAAASDPGAGASGVPGSR